MKDVAIIFGIIAFCAALVVGVGLLVRKYDPPRPWTCADYANWPRERTPARCFDDYREDRP